MSYSSYWYLLIFLTLVFAVYSLVPVRAKWTVLLGASLLFYLLSSGYLVVFVLVSSLSIFLSGLCLTRIQENFQLVKKRLEGDEKKQFKQNILWQKKFIAALCIVFNIGLLAFLKQYGFLKEQIDTLLSWLQLSYALPKLSLAMPLGISFYTLQAVSYVTDIYRGKYAAQTNYGKIVLYLCFFPLITEGPICRYDQLGSQLYEGHRFSYDNMLQGILLILWGCFKKIVIADRAAGFVNAVFDNSGKYGGLVVVTAMLLYTLQLYADFSGCIDIASGSARLFGIELAPNFRQPFFSKSASEFWRRWHISLGTWFKDYVFYPVSLSKPFTSLSKKAQKYCNPHFASFLPAAASLFVVWYLTGLWHGASWKYVLYGLYYFALIVMGMLFEPVFARLSMRLHINRQGRVMSGLSIFRTFVFVNIGMLLFRSKGALDFFAMFASIFSPIASGMILNGSFFKISLDGYDFAVLAIGVAVMLTVGILKEKGYQLEKHIATGSMLIRWPVYLALLFSVILFGAYGANYTPVDFMYAKF